MKKRKATTHSDEILIKDIEEEDRLMERKKIHNVEKDVSCDKDNLADIISV